MVYQDFFRRILLIIVMIAFVVVAWYVRSTLVLAFMALVLAVGLSIPVNWLQKHKWPRGWAIALSVLIFLIISSLIVAILLPTIFNEMVKLVLSVPAAFGVTIDLYEQLRNTNEIVAEVLPPSSDLSSVEVLEGLVAQLLSGLGQVLERGIPVILSGVGDVAVALINLVLVVFLAIFFLTDPLSYVRASLYLIPEAHHESLLNLWNEMYHTLTTWIRTLMLSITIIGFLVWFVLGVIMGMPNSLTVAVFAGVATLIPNIGFWLPLVPILIFNLASEPGLLLYVIPAYLIIQTVESNFITPSIVKAQLNIPAAGMMVCQLIMGIVFGPLGLLLAVPIVAVLIAIIRELYSFGWLGFRGKHFEVGADENGRLFLKSPSKAAD